MKTSSVFMTLGVAAVLVVWAPFSTRAGELKLWMDAFKKDMLPHNGTSKTATFYQNPAYFGIIEWAPSEDTSWGWVPLKLPVGTVVKSIAYYHGDSLGNYTYCDLVRVKHGKEPHVIAQGTSKASSAATITLSLLGVDSIVIQPNYRYYIRVQVATGTHVNGVRVLY